MYTLQQDRSYFRALLEQIFAVNNINVNIIEKDYYVCAFLQELSEKQFNKGLQAYFKGGTALYKILATQNRFSEDIDLTVEISDAQSRNQQKRRLEIAANGYTSLSRTMMYKSMEQNVKNSITSIYDYVSFFPKGDVLERFNTVKVEATSFTVSEPFETITVLPMLYDLATAKDKKILEKEFDILPISVKTITLERIFVDKIMAAELLYTKATGTDNKKNYIETAKHMYDLNILLSQDRIKKLLEDETEFKKLVKLKKLEESRRLGSDLDTRPFSEYHVFAECLNNTELREAFKNMQNIYIFDEQYLCDYNDVCSAVSDVIFPYLLALENNTRQTFTANNCNYYEEEI